MEGALVVLGSATPSLESAANARAGRYELVRLTQRVLDRPLADRAHRRHAAGVRGARRGRGRSARRSSRRSGIGSHGGEQTRRAAQPARVRDGDLLPAVRRVDRVPALQRHADLPPAAAAAALPLLQLRGGGAEASAARAAASISSSRASAPSGSRPTCASGFPARVSRAWIATRFAGAARLRACCAASRAGTIDILVGTQMIAKGHDFPAVTLVGVVSADVGLGLADFRAAERTFQLLTQVVGRAGRGETPGEAIVQTLYPRSLQRPGRRRAGLRAVLRARDGVPASLQLSADGRAHQRRREGAITRRGADRRARSRETGSPSRRARPRPRPRAGGDVEDQGRVSRAVLHQGTSAKGDADRAADRAGRTARVEASNRSWMWIRSV